MAPATAPAWMRDRASLWSGVEAAEKRKDAQLAREVHFALPRELDRTGRVELIREFCQREFVARGMICDIAVHNPPDRAGAEQPHAHVMLTTRVLTGEGFGAKDRDWNDKALYEGWRAGWAEHANRALERVGSPERIDHRSFAERGIDREPEPKLGPKAVRLERAEAQAAANENRSVIIVTERGQEWQNVRERNQVRDQLRGQLELGLRELREVAARVIAEARGQLEASWQRIERAIASVRERFVGGRSEGLPVTSQPEQPSLDQLLGRKDRDKAGGDAGYPGQVGPTDLDALLGKTSMPPDWSVTTPADLLGRNSVKHGPQHPIRDKNSDRDR